MKITNKIYAAHLDTDNEVSEQDATRYGELCETAIRRRYPNAEIDTQVLMNVSGAGSGVFVTGDDPIADLRAEDECRLICARIYQAGEFWS